MKRQLLILVAFALPLAIEEAAAERQRSKGADPKDLVKKDGQGGWVRIANGCGSEGGEWLDEQPDGKRFADEHIYGRGFTVDFRDACDLHDVAYEGTFYAWNRGKPALVKLVYDKILDEDVDYSDKSREWIDTRFLAHMRAICARKIVPRNAHDRARATESLAWCQGDGNNPKFAGVWGAETLYKLVRKHARSNFNDLDGARANPAPPAPNRGTYR